MAKKAPPATAGKTESAGAQPAAAPIRPPKKTEINLRVEFTRDEIVELALKQGEAFNELNRAEEDKKAVTAQLKAKCEGISARISEITGKLTSGFEYRVVPCEIRYDDPKPGLKTTYRLDTGATVNIDPMTLAERQAELDLNGKAAPLPGADIALAPIEAAKRDASTAAQQKQSEERLAVRKVTPGTVEVPSDEGSRDDAGDETKND